MTIFYQQKEPLILASSSPRRKELLSQVHIQFQAVPAKNEPEPKDGENPLNYAMRSARAKAAEVAAFYPESLILSADTIIEFEGKTIGKPQGLSEKEQCTHALEILTSLQGRAHLVHTAYSFFHKNLEIDTLTSTSEVCMRKASSSELMRYVATKEPLDKAGAYAIQGIGSFLIDKINGSYHGIIGLPIAGVIEKLLEYNFITINNDEINL